MPAISKRFRGFPAHSVKRIFEGRARTIVRTLSALPGSQRLGVSSRRSMPTQFSRLLAFATLVALGSPLSAQQPAAAPQGAERQAAPAPAAAKPQDTEVWDPVPKVVTLPSNNPAPPSAAILLLDAHTLHER